jgi:hypothetical protein
LSTNVQNQTPENTLDRSDPGDDIQMRFRYQHAYGVILLAGALSGRNSYTAIWCEHHDDFLAQETNGGFDSFQVKTKEVGLPAWKMGDAPLQRSLSKFIQQDRRFPNQIHHFHFVSNHNYFDTTVQNQLAKSPACVKRAVDNAVQVDTLDEPFASLVRDLARRSVVRAKTYSASFKGSVSPKAQVWTTLTMRWHTPIWRQCHHARLCLPLI